jgi:hypothetical protein
VRRVLFDENMPRKLRRELAEFAVELFRKRVGQA